MTNDDHPEDTNGRSDETDEPAPTGAHETDEPGRTEPTDGTADHDTDEPAGDETAAAAVEGATAETEPPAPTPEVFPAPGPGATTIDADDTGDDAAAASTAPPSPTVPPPPTASEDTQPPPPPSAARPPGAAPPPPGGAAATPGQPSAPQGPRRLTRSRDRKIGGVAGGIAEYLGIDPTLVRLGFLLAVFIGGAGVIAYVVAWIVLPEGDGSPPTGPGRPPLRVRRDGGLDTTTALAVGLLSLAVLFGLAAPDGGKVLVPLAMIAGGIWLLSQRGSPRVGDDTGAFSTAAPTAPTPGGTVAFQADDTYRSAQRWEQPAADPVDADADPMPEPRPPAVVTRVTLSLLALLAAAAIAANELDIVDVTVPGVLAIALVVVGVGAITGAFVGRGRGLIPVGLLLALAFGAAVTAQPLVEDGTGRRQYVAVTPADVRDEYRLGVGELDVDLSGLDIEPGATVETSVDLGIGSAEILVPDDVDVIVDGEVGMGELRILGSEENGFGNDLRRTRSVPDAEDTATGATADDVDTPGTLIIELDVGIGEGVVRDG